MNINQTLTSAAVATAAVAGLSGLAAAQSLPREVDPAFVSRLDQVLDRAVSTQRIVGAVVLVAREGELVYHRAVGMADREAGRALREDDIFRLASLSKPIVTSVALALVERRRLELDAPITRWLPWFRPRLADGTEPVILVRHLLTHTAGFDYGFNQPADGPYGRAGISDGLDHPGLTLEENLRRLATVPLAYEPGTGWRYSLATDVLGAVLEQAGEAPLPQLVETLVTGPLGMRETGFFTADTARLVTPYADGDPAPVRMGEEHLVPFAGVGAVRFTPRRALDRSAYPSGGAGMVGTAHDFLLLLEALRLGGAPILQAETVSELTRNQVGSLAVQAVGAGSGFGLGFAVLEDPNAAGSPQSPGTFWWGGAYGHSWWVDPARRLSIVVLTNTTPEGLSGAFPREVRDAVYAALAGNRDIRTDAEGHDQR